MRLHVEVPVLYDKIDCNLEKLGLPNSPEILDTFTIPEVIDLFNIRSIRTLLKSNGKPSNYTVVGFYTGPDMVLDLPYIEFKNKFAEKIDLVVL